MPIVDERGRIFGRLNVIDAALLAFVLALVPIAFTAVRLFRQPAPVLERIEPARQPVGAGRRIAVHGRSLRPFLRAFVNPTGRPYSVLDRRAETSEGIVRIETPDVMEVELPPTLAEGTYDLYIYDELREVAHRTAAFQLTSASIDEHVLAARVRFVVPPAVATSVKSGDADVTERTPPKGSDSPPGPAVLGEVRVLGRGPTTFELMQVPKRSRWLGGTLENGIAIEARVAIPAQRTREGVWQYAELPVRVGDPFFFQTASYSMSGIIQEVRDDGVSAARGGQ